LKHSRTRSLLSALLGILTFAACAADGPESRIPIELITRTERYLITGASVDRINRQLLEHAQRSSGRGHGLTRSRFDLIRKLKPTAGPCAVLELGIQIEFTTILPDWQPERAVSSELIEEWKRSVSALERHEEGHRQNALSTANALREALQNMGPTLSCMILDARMAIEFQSQLDRLQRIDASYDRRTSNGLRDDPRLGGRDVQPESLRRQRRTEPDWSVLERHQ
jgi:predicted secreted Zn-dependent protease